MSEALVQRLASVVARLEAYASKVTGGGGGSDSKGGGEESRASAAYSEYYSSVVQPFIDACRKQKETSTIGDWTETAFKRQGELIKAAGQCKKPSQADLLNFVKPISDIMGTADGKVDNRSPWFNHQKAFAEGVVALGWVANSGASKPVVQAGLEQADFYLIKILTAAKNKTGEEQANLQAYAKGWKETLSKLAEFAHEYAKLGIDFNPKGGDLNSWSGGGGDAPASDGGDMGFAPPPPGPPPSADDLMGGSTTPAPQEKKGGMAGVFSEISKGSSVTSGLKKVDRSQMTHKNPELRNQPGLAPKEKAAKGDTKKAAKADAPKKPPSLELQKGTWFVENYEDAGLIEVKDVEVKQSVYVSKCRNVNIVINDKCKAISIDGCFRVTVTFKSVVSSVELFNSQRCTVEVLESCPSVAVDKSDGSSVVLTKASFANPPQLVTSKISESNLVVPGATDEADPIEIPIPEQFVTTISAQKKLSTVPMAHGD